MRRLIVAMCALLFLAPAAWAQNSVTNIVTNQGFGLNKPCDSTGNLSAGTFYQVSADNA
jgi:hypothetical protein